MAAFNVKAHWDSEARVWWAESDDVPGLVAEAETHDDLIQELRHIVPELLALNMPSVRGVTHTMHILSDQIEEMCDA